MTLFSDQVQYVLAIKSTSLCTSEASGGTAASHYPARRRAFFLPPRTRRAFSVRGPGWRGLVQEKGPLAARTWFLMGFVQKNTPLAARVRLDEAGARHPGASPSSKGGSISGRG